MRNTLACVSVACLVVIPSSTVSAASLRDEAVKYRDEGYERQQHGDFEGAKTAYQKAAAINPADPILQNYFGLYHQRLGDLDDAKQYYRRALEMDPSYTDALWNLASLHNQLGNKEQALFHWLKLGMIYEQQQNFEQAQKAYQQVLEIDPNYLEANTNLAWVQERTNNTQQAVFHWLKSGLLYEKLGELDAARQAYRRALMLDPEFVEAQANLAVLQERMGNREETLQQWLRLGQLYDQHGQLDAATRAYEHALGYDSTSLQALASLAVLAERTGHRDRAIAYWTKARQVGSPNDPWRVRAEQELMALGVLKTGPAYHRFVLEQELKANQQSLEEFQTVTETRQK